MRSSIQNQKIHSIVGVILAGTLVVSGMIPVFAAEDGQSTDMQGGRENKSLTALVTAGTITSDQETAIEAALKTGWTSKEKPSDSLAALVTSGTITADQEKAVETALSSHEMFGSSKLDALVTAGTITADQKTAVESAMQSARTAKTKVNDALAALVTVGTLTQDQETAIETAITPTGNFGRENGSTGTSGTHTRAEDKTSRAGFHMVINGKEVTGEVSPYVDKNSRTMVELKTIADELGATLTWDNPARTATLTANGKTVEIKIDQNSYKLNGSEKAMDTAAVINNGHTMVPARIVSEALGAGITYDSATQTVTITH